MQNTNFNHFGVFQSHLTWQIRLVQRDEPSTLRPLLHQRQSGYLVAIVNKSTTLQLLLRFPKRCVRLLSLVSVPRLELVTCIDSRGLFNRNRSKR